MEGKLNPHGILLKKEEEKEQFTAGGLLIPATKKTSQKIATVYLCGTGTPEKPMEVKPGDTVYYSVHSAREVDIEGEKFHLIDSNDCLYIVSE